MVNILIGATFRGAALIRGEKLLREGALIWDPAFIRANTVLLNPIQIFEYFVYLIYWFFNLQLSSKMKVGSNLLYYIYYILYYTILYYVIYIMLYILLLTWEQGNKRWKPEVSHLSIFFHQQHNDHENCT